MPRRLWTEDELKRARDMRAAGRTYGEIDKALGRLGRRNAAKAGNCRQQIGGSR